MSHSRRFTLRAALTMTVAVLGSMLAIAGTQAPASAAGLTDTAPTSQGLMATTANGTMRCPYQSKKVTAACLKHALKDFNRARAKEGLGPMKLPANFLAMSAKKQLRALTNVDRVDRGLKKMGAVSANLNPYTQPAANQGGDPHFPPWTQQGGSNWASTLNPLWTEYLWMYFDGPDAGINLDCGQTGHPGCWAHRKNILLPLGGHRIMGISFGKYGTATLMMGRDKHDWLLLHPNAVRKLTATKLAGNKVRVTWTAPTKRGTAVQGFYRKRDGGKLITMGPKKRGFTSAALPRGTHTFKVRAFNKGGKSAVRSVSVTIT